MVTSLMIFHGVISALLIIFVLLQFGKGAEAGLMGGASEAVFSGSQQGNILSKITVVLTIVFIANCLILGRMHSGKESKSILDSEAPVAAPLNSDTTAPVTAPATTTPATETAK